MTYTAEITNKKLVHQWGLGNYRLGRFGANRPIRTREGLIYMVVAGFVRLVGKNGNIIQIVGEGGIFEVSEGIEAIAQSNTSIVWLRWDELKIWKGFKTEVVEAFRDRSRFQVKLLNVLSETLSNDRVLAFITLLASEYGLTTDIGLTLPFAMTHQQIADTLAITRVTVTRVMAELRLERKIAVSEGSIVRLYTPLLTA